MRVLLATGIEQLDKALQERLGENVSVCYYREAVVEEALKQDAEVVVLSISLPGTAAVGIEDVVLELRMANRRVVLLPGARDGSRFLVRRAVALGVYDIVYDPLSVDAILERIRRPAVLADVGKATGETPESALPEEVIPDYVEQENSVRKVPFSFDRFRGFARHLPGVVKKGAFFQKPLESGDEFQYEVSIYQDEEVNQFSAVDYAEAGIVETSVEGDIGAETGNSVLESNTVVFCLGDVPVKPGIRCFFSFPELTAALKETRPDAVVVGPGIGDVETLVKELRRLAALGDVPVGVIGGGAECYAAGADDCFEELTEETLTRLLQKKDRLKALWANASKDELTGCYTRRFLENYLSGLETNGTLFAVLMCDLDHFKKVNDTHGHPAGDTVLREFGAFLRGRAREIDVVVRYGGEEFIVVFPRTRREEAVEIAERLRRGWQEKGLYGSTFSGGVAEYGIDGRTTRKVVEAADRALYTAKADGRNNVKLAGQQLERSPIVFVPRIVTGKLAVRVFVVIGTAHRVGATAFALGLAARAASKYPVEVIDAGGGASRWLKDGVVSCRKAPPLSVVPGVVTVIDAGLEASPEALSLAQAVFVVTDAVAVVSSPPVPGGYLVGGRGALEGAVKELARLWAMEYFGCLSEAQEVKQAELAGGLPRPRSWRKLLGRVVA